MEFELHSGHFPIQILNSNHLCLCNKQQLGPTKTITDPGLLGYSAELYDWHTEQTVKFNPCLFHQQKTRHFKSIKLWNFVKK